MLLPAPAEILIHKSESILGANDNGRKINVWSTNIFSNELHTAVSVAFSVPSSMQSEASFCTEEGTLNATKTAVCNSFENLLALQTLIFLPLSFAPSFVSLSILQMVGKN